jgi:hypothetical protein
MWFKGGEFSPPSPWKGMTAERVTGVMVDFLWEEQRLTVQVDGPGRPYRNPNEHIADLALESAGYASSTSPKRNSKRNRTESPISSAEN